jgi:hypothetical protein
MNVPTKGHHRSINRMPINGSLRKMTLKGILINIVLTVNSYLSRNDILLKSNATITRRDMTTWINYNSVVVVDQHSGSQDALPWFSCAAHLLPYEEGIEYYVSYIKLGRKLSHCLCLRKSKVSKVVS